MNALKAEKTESRHWNYGSAEDIPGRYSGEHRNPGFREESREVKE
jgi:hypothetical protein